MPTIREDKVYGTDLQYARVSDDTAVLKRGINELVVSGVQVHSILQALMPQLDGSRTREDIIDSFPEHLRGEVSKLLTTMQLRRLITQEPGPDVNEASLESLQTAFWWNMGEEGRNAPQRLGNAHVVVAGVTLIARAMVRSLLESGIGRITLVDDTDLNNEVAPVGFQPGEDRLRRVPELPSDGEVSECSIICATSDFDQADALLEFSRTALRIEKPFLPVWQGDLLGYVGPLNHPYENDCLRCYFLRRESNNPNYAAARALRRHASANPGSMLSAGLLPPMASALGEIAALEIVKFIAGYPPPDTAGRSIEVNLFSFSSTVRRVLKIPRCPDCGEIMRKASRALIVGSLIPHE
jgi:bacteriocin biosynthesis cyclodehydratase domain-containing protein